MSCPLSKSSILGIISRYLKGVNSGEIQSRSKELVVIIDYLTYTFAEEHKDSLPNLANMIDLLKSPTEMKRER